MLQTMRENMKGTVAILIVGFLGLTYPVAAATVKILMMSLKLMVTKSQSESYKLPFSKKDNAYKVNLVIAYPQSSYLTTDCVRRPYRASFSAVLFRIEP
jgi:hypothetical protein